VSIEKLEINGNGPHADQTNSAVATKQHRKSEDHMVESVTYHQNGFAAQKASSNQHQDPNQHRDEESSPSQTSIVKHSLLQFALQHFRNE
jgi:hypothetical protein